MIRFFSICAYSLYNVLIFLGLAGWVYPRTLSPAIRCIMNASEAMTEALGPLVLDANG